MMKIRKSWLTPSKTPLGLLRKVRTLLTPKERWTQDTLARTKDGATCKATGPAAEAFCLLGAIQRAKDGTRPSVITAAEEALAEAIDPRFREFLLSYRENGGPEAQRHDRQETITNFNDNLVRNHREMLRTLDRAIKSLRPGRSR